MGNRKSAADGFVLRGRQAAGTTRGEYRKLPPIAA